MGWTYYNATHYKNGKIDRLAECRAEFSRHPDWATIVKDALVGTTYYAAMKTTKTGETWALVVLTSIRDKEFGYKDMSEDMEPYYYDCPKTILDRLSPTDNIGALEWRKKCNDQILKRKEFVKMGKLLKKAQNIQITLPNDCTSDVYRPGETIILTKHTDGRWVDLINYIAFSKKNLFTFGFTVLK